MDSKDELLARTLYHLDQDSLEHPAARYLDFQSNVAKIIEEEGKFLLGEWFLHDFNKPSFECLQKYNKEEVDIFYTQNYSLPAMILMSNANIITGCQKLVDEVDTSWLDDKIIFNETQKCYQLCYKGKFHKMYIECFMDHELSLPYSKPVERVEEKKDNVGDLVQMFKDENIALKAEIATLKSKQIHDKKKEIEKHLR